MAHLQAFIDSNNKVIEVFCFDQAVPDSSLIEEVKNLVGAVEAISCDIYGRAHINSYWRDGEFTEPQPYPSWIYNEIEKDWDAPVPMPTDAIYTWNEEKLEWEFLIALPT